VIKVLNGQLSLDDLEEGTSVKAQIEARRLALDPRRQLTKEQLRAKIDSAQQTLLGPSASARIDVLRAMGPAALAGAPDPGATFAETLKQHPDVEALLLNDETLHAFAPDATDASLESLPASARPSAWGDPKALRERLRARNQAALMRNITLAEFADDAVLGL